MLRTDAIVTMTTLNAFDGKKATEKEKQAFDAQAIETVQKMAGFFKSIIRFVCETRPELVVADPALMKLLQSLLESRAYKIDEVADVAIDPLILG